MTARPPSFLRSVVGWLLPSGRVRDGLLGDLDELYDERARSGRVRADLWYVRQVVSATVRYLPYRVTRSGVRATGLLGGIGGDVVYALRSLRRRPGFAAVVVMTLALGVGVNTAIFSVVDAVLLRPLPYPQSDRLVHVQHERRGDEGNGRGRFSREDFADIHREAASHLSLAAYTTGVRVLTGRGEPLELTVGHVSAGLFRVLRTDAALGRTFREDEMVDGADRVVVLSDAFWRSRLGADPGVVGQTIILDDSPLTVIGVMPPSFAFPTPDVSMWAPVSHMGCDRIPCGRASRPLIVIGRLARDVSVRTAGAAVNGVLARLATAHPETNEGWGAARIVSLHGSIVSDARPALLVLFGAVALVLLVSCANVANLLLARGTTRTREYAIRAALGAGRWRVVRQTLAESCVLAAAGGALGFVLAYAGVDALVALSAWDIPRSHEIRPDLRVAGFALAVSILTGLLFGILPALAASRTNVRDSLAAGGRSGLEGGRTPVGRGPLIIVEIATAVVLLASAGLLLRTVWNLTRVDTGFRSENVLSLSISMTASVMGGDARNAYRREIMQRIGNLPGVLAVGGSKDVPLHGATESYALTTPDRTEPTYPATHIVTGDFFDALGIRLVEGRLFTESDEVNEAPVMIVNETLVRQYWQGRSPVGTQARVFDDDVAVIGVVTDVKHNGITEAATPAIYILPHFGGRRSMYVYVRTAGDPLSLADAIRGIIWNVNPDQPVARIATMEQVTSDTIREPQSLAILLSAFSVLAIVLASIGVYGVTAHEVSRRTYEVGVRLALGAESSNVQRLIIRQGLSPVLAGLAIGLIAAWAATRVVANLLFGVRATDPGVFTGAGMLLIVVALIAVWIPARRAASVDPILALRAR
jgi:predicted permease